MVFPLGLFLFALLAEGQFLNITRTSSARTSSLNAIPTPLPDYLANRGDWYHVYDYWGDWNASDPLPPNIPYRRSPKCSADYSSSFLNNTKTTTPQTSLYDIGCCGPKCMMRFGDVNIYYFPTQKSNDTCLQYVSFNLTHVTKGIPDTRTAANTANTQPPASAITPRALRPRDGESIVVDDKGFTFKSPYMYLELLTVDAVDGCGYLGGKYTSLTWSFLPGELSITNERLNSKTPLYPDYLPCPPESIASFDWYNYILPGPGRPWRPTIVPPPALTRLEPLWNKGCDVNWQQGRDPPKALKPAAMPIFTSPSRPGRTESPKPGSSPQLPPSVTSKTSDPSRPKNTGLPQHEESKPVQPISPTKGAPQNGPTNGAPQNGPSNGAPQIGPSNGAPQDGPPLGLSNGAPQNGPPLPPTIGAPQNGQPVVPTNGAPQNSLPSNGVPQNNGPQNPNSRIGDPPNGAVQNGSPTLPVLQPVATVFPPNGGPAITQRPNTPNALSQGPGAPNPPSSSLVVYKVPGSDLTVTYDPSAGNFIIGSQTVAPGGSTVSVSGHVFSVPTARPTSSNSNDPPVVIVDGTSTFAVSSTQPGPGKGVSATNGGGAGTSVAAFTGAASRVQSTDGTSSVLYSSFVAVFLVMLSM